MSKLKNIKKKKSPMLWYGWAISASKHFKCSRGTIRNRFNKNDYELLTWIHNEMTEKKAKQSEALSLKKEITKETK